MTIEAKDIWYGMVYTGKSSCYDDYVRGRMWFLFGSCVCFSVHVMDTEAFSFSYLLWYRFGASYGWI